MNTSRASAEFATASDTTTLVPYRAPPSDAVNDGKWRRWPGALRGAVARVQHWIRSLGPYVAIELLLPGGTIIALVLWAYRQRRAARGAADMASQPVAPAERGAPMRGLASCTQR